MKNTRHFVLSAIAGILIGIVIAFLTEPAHAADITKNPDQMPSIGWLLSNGHLPMTRTTVPDGLESTNGAYIRWMIDVRYPISNTVTLNFEAELTGVNNNRDFSNGTRLGVGMRVYLPGMK